MQSFDIRKLIQEAPLFFIVTTALLVVLSLFRYSILPLYQNAVIQNKELRRYRALISSESGYALIKKEIGEKIELLKGKLQPLPEHKNITSDPSTFLETLITVARETDIRFVRLQPQTESQTEDYKLYPVLLDFTTSFHTLGQFISSIEKLPHMYRVNRLGITTAKGGKCVVKLLITCLIPLDNNNSEGDSDD